MGELGLMGIFVPERWGGAGGDVVAYSLAMEEIARVCGSHAVVMSVNNSLFCDPINKYGTDAQRERFLRPVASGHEIGCFALTEPQAGSDATNQHTLALRDGDHYVVNGRKVFVTNGREASAALVLVQTDVTKGSQSARLHAIGDGEALRGGDGHESHHRRRADPRGLRFHQGIRGRAVLPRRQDHADLRRDVADLEARLSASCAGRKGMSDDRE